MVNFSKIVVFTGTILIVISLILAFKLRKKEGLPEYFRFFYWIPVMALLVSINGIFFIYLIKVFNSTFNAFQHLFFLAEFAFTYFIFFTIFNNKKLVIIVFLISITSISMLLFINGLSKVLFQLYAIPGLTIFILCMYYYYQLFNNEEPNLNLLRNPTFWIVTGLFFFAAITLPLFAIQEYFTYEFGRAIGSFVLSIANIFVIVKHLFFIKAYRVAKFTDVKN